MSQIQLFYTTKILYIYLSVNLYPIYQLATHWQHLKQCLYIQHDMEPQAKLKLSATMCIKISFISTVSVSPLSQKQNIEQRDVFHLCWAIVLNAYLTCEPVNHKMFKNYF